MGEYFPADIAIGGVLTKHLCRDLIKVAIAQRAMPLGEDEEDNLEVLRQAINEAVQSGFSLELWDAQASYGMFDELEIFCRKHNLSYDRHSEAHFEYDAEVVWWRPGMAQARSATSTQDGEKGAYIAVKAVQKALDAQGITPQQRLLNIQELLKDSAPPELPPLTYKERRTPRERPRK
jgi:hypothetical protein